ncbi:Do family serine endopeptidase [Azonexus sp.]|jgi:serine protease DegQ|uniref:Do family serine endopeptidase n=1 Tax=Azonexus sp. TaxID=1872668 RepID=UPI00282BE00C|nr:Do family serine endopeptidase [Azonexus sp.]MDR1996259.1 Do family serine endopeptidase [Azonexus sp.]
MHRLWLIFAQTVTIAVAILFVVGTLKPEWLGQRPAVVALQNAPYSADSEAPMPGSYRDAARAALPSVVHIYTTQTISQQRHPLLDDPIFRHFFGERPDGPAQRNATGLGSGVIVSPNGHILTNYHVIEGADDIQVSLNDGSSHKARVIGSDPESDLAVLQIKADKLPTITFDQDEQVRVGDVVLAIGNPFGVGQTVTMGIVSALGRSHLGINTFENFIQTDAAINPGNSGGALVDIKGNLVGINTAIYSRTGGNQGIGFAIPVSSARSIMEQIIEHGSVTRGWIGVETQEISPELAESFGLPDTDGALIAGIMHGGPAATAGIRPGDVLLAVNGKPVRDPQAMIDQIAALRPDDKASLRLRRDRSISEVEVKIGKRPTFRQEKE